MKVTRRTALLTALGIPVAAKVPLAEAAVRPLAPVVPITNAYPNAMVGAGWCAPSEMIYDLGALTTNVYDVITMPEVKVIRGGIKFKEWS